MNKARLKRMKGKEVRLWPIAKRIDLTRGELPERDDVWKIMDGDTPNEITLENIFTGLRFPNCMDHIVEYRTDPNGPPHRLILKSQVIDKNGQLFVEPLTRVALAKQNGPEG